MQLVMCCDNSAEKETDDEVPPLWYVNQKLFSQKMRNEVCVCLCLSACACMCMNV